MTHKKGLEEIFWQMRLVVARSMNEAHAERAHQSANRRTGTGPPLSGWASLSGRGTRAPTAQLWIADSTRKATKKAVHKNACFFIGRSHSNKNGYPSSP